MKSEWKAAITAFGITLTLFMFCFSGWQILKIVYANREAASFNAKVQKHFVTSSEDSTIPAIDWQMLQTKYQDVVGWLYCPDTELDCMVVQGEDNDYYLTHLADGSYNKHGTIFADYRSKALLSGDNTLFYGHNMQDGTMFHCLLNWGNTDYAAAHTNFYFMTPHETYEIRVFNACVVDVTSEVYQTDFTESKGEWLERCAKLSYFSADFTPNEKSPIVTFSTCSGKNNRFVVQGEAQIEQG